ncbi:MAG: polymerase, sigma-24 subunit, subfamily [Candidatus Taylorbacteria bacterium]|nr:polymerase, sigma-24 subunit, subfamily [Candidatus Taylorbacteria bacterium]
MDTRTDTELVQAYIDGDVGAFDVIVRRYSKSIFAFTYHLAGNPTDAQDIVQEIFMKSWKHIRKFDSEKAGFKPWLFAIARNTAIDWLRKKRPATFTDIDADRSRSSDDAAEQFGNAIPDGEPLADEIFEKKELAERIESMLASLPPDERTIILLHHYEMLTFEEIAEILKKPMNTVKSRYRRTLAKLKDAPKPGQGTYI